MPANKMFLFMFSLDFFLWQGYALGRDFSMGCNPVFLPTGFVRIDA